MNFFKNREFRIRIADTTQPTPIDEARRMASGVIKDIYKTEVPTEDKVKDVIDHAAYAIAGTVILSVAAITAGRIASCIAHRLICK